MVFAVLQVSGVDREVRGVETLQEKKNGLKRSSPFRVMSKIRKSVQLGSINGRGPGGTRGTRAPGGAPGGPGGGPGGPGPVLGALEVTMY